MTTGTTQEAAISPGRAACEAFWAAIGAGPITQKPGSAWSWAVSQGATGAWEAAAKAAVAAERAAEETAGSTTACKRCRKPIVRCETLPAHFGCSSARGWIHAGGGAHACEPRSDGPYAEPAEVTP